MHVGRTAIPQEIPKLVQFHRILDRPPMIQWQVTIGQELQAASDTDRSVDRHSRDSINKRWVSQNLPAKRPPKRYPADCDSRIAISKFKSPDSHSRDPFFGLGVESAQCFGESRAEPRARAVVQGLTKPVANQCGPIERVQPRAEKQSRAEVLRTKSPYGYGYLLLKIRESANRASFSFSQRQANNPFKMLPPEMLVIVDSRDSTPS
jgi:hypothetical protein